MYRGGICFITDRTYADVPVFDMVRAVLEAGVTFVQYREKNESRRAIFETAVRLRGLTRSFGATFIVNDHADIAAAADADGVHLGQDDLPLAAARKVVGSRIVGISTHSPEQARAAASAGADYIGFGPIFPTSTKDAGQPQGVDMIRAIAQNVHVPVVAIGGISAVTAPDVLKAGAACIAVATAICRGDISGNARDFVQILRGSQRG